MEPLLAACLVLPLFVGGQSLTPSEFEARVDDTLNKVSQFEGQNCCQLSLGHFTMLHFISTFHEQPIFDRDEIISNC